MYFQEIQGTGIWRLYDCEKSLMMDILEWLNFKDFEDVHISNTKDNS